MTAPPVRVSYSGIDTYRSCPRRYYYSNVERWETVAQPRPLAFGTAFHSALEAWWGAGSEPAQRLSAALRVWGLETPRRGLCPEDVVLGEVLLQGYTAMWHEDHTDGARAELPVVVPVLGPDGPAEGLTLKGVLDVDLAGSVVEHKCLAAETPLFNHDTGRYEAIGDLAAEGRPPRVTAMLPDGSLTVAQALAPIAQEPRMAYAITTASGRRLVASDNHPIWTPREWCPAGALRPGDFVAVARHLRTDTPEVLRDEEVRLIGYMIGDGSLTNMTLVKRERAVLDDAIRCAEALGETASLNQPTSGRVPFVRFSKRGAVARLMKRAGLSGKLAADKSLPDIPLSDRQAAVLIGALWSTDGCVDLQRDRARRKPRIIYTSRSKALCDGIRDLLQRVGLVSRVRASSVSYKGERRPVYTTQVITRESKRRFLELAMAGDIPVIRSAAPLSEVLAAIPDSRCGDDSRLQPDIHEHLWWDRVESVVAVGERVLYDLEVPGPSTFVADGIVTHNTTTSDIRPGGSYWQRLERNLQIPLYFILREDMGRPIDSILWDVVRAPEWRLLPATPPEKREFYKVNCKGGKKGDPKPGTRLEPETMEQFRERVTKAVLANPEEFFQRKRIYRTEEDLEKVRADLYGYARLIQASHESGLWPRNTGACEQYRRECSFAPICHRGADVATCGLYRKREKQLHSHTEDGSLSILKPEAA